MAMVVLVIVSDSGCFSASDGTSSCGRASGGASSCVDASSYQNCWLCH